jgi:nitroreductase
MHPAPTDVWAGEEPERVLRRRGSARTFTADPIPKDELAAILEAAAGPIQADFEPTNEIFLVANAVEGLEPGAYRYTDGFELLKAGNFRMHAGYLALEQAHAAYAAATHFLMADLDDMLPRLGNRGYRVAQLEAGIRAGRIYLAAYARGYGATGLTFYDDEVSRFFETTRSPMLCVAAGPHARR